MGDCSARLASVRDQREDVEIGGIAGDDRAGGRVAVDLGKDDAFHLGLLDHGFDDQIGVMQGLAGISVGLIRSSAARASSSVIEPAS